MVFDSDEFALILSGVQILQDLDVEVIEDIAARARIAEFSKDDVIVKAGDVGERLYFICDGKLEVQIPGPGGLIKRRVQVKKGDVIGEISLLVQSNYSADIVALTDATMLYLDRPCFQGLIEVHPDFAEVMSQLMTSRMAQNGGINKVGKYELRGKLGEGNMATVFNAWDPVLEREVAIKMLKYNLAYDDEFLRRFEREAKTIASLNHPNIINVFEIVDEFSTRFIVMEKLYGQDLSATLARIGAFDPVQARDILAQIASALHYAHSHGERGIVHRDIKPSNIVIDDYGNIKLTDFGIASPPRDKEASIEGTPSYLAPEIIQGAEFDGRADIYAMGVMAFHMLTGSLPFTAVTLAKMLQMQVNHKPPDIRRSCPNIDGEFARFIEGALCKEPEDRIADWHDIRNILKPLHRLDLGLDPDELAVIVRFRDTTYQQSAKAIHSIQKMLEEEGINHQIEMHRGDGDTD